MIIARALVHPDLRRGADRGDHEVEAAVSVEVGYRATSMPGSGTRGSERGEGAASQIAKHRIRLFDSHARSGPQGLDVAARHEQVLPAVIIEIGDRRRVSGHWQAESLHAAGARDVGKFKTPGRSKVAENGERFVVECR